ncbi:uncharacterized protein RSE6_15035 [Rhynchosporium secalis]|uniref:Uncharacterized protein n=1 Tax=Rhynchosporium secalis TaxID=38038 RepID=A0A1E1MWW6_RHYSE|nr:uncharacterized protein RSE6_15035 [Rhynchosporium secalis]
MEELEKTLDLLYPLQEHFDYGIRTSSGGMVIIGFFTKSWTPKQYLEFFLKFTRIIFPLKRGYKYSIYAILRRIFASYLADSGYDAVVLEKALKEVFGLGRVFNSVNSRLSGMKFAVTAITISDAILCLISNYNSNYPPSSDSKNDRRDATLGSCEVYNSCSNPSFFTLKYLELYSREPRIDEVDKMQYLRNEIQYYLSDMEVPISGISARITDPERSLRVMWTFSEANQVLNTVSLGSS